MARGRGTSDGLLSRRRKRPSCSGRSARSRYPGAGAGAGVRPALARTSFTARPGELLLVTGPSGAGKSTVSKLLLRFYDPDSGTVTLDGVPLPHLPLARLRAQVALLPQETLVETGRHEELLSRPGGAYARLHRSQNNAVVDTGELRLPLSADDGRPLFRDEVWLPGGVDGRR
ncbi:ATP-binding cassette domain-containing protein [Streptomyces lydicus]|uniref:ATP-binding cassette domain-containing protein n=1 Tax=Streptomyces lydicus TaxID=47763 RepID=UPI0037B9AF34